MEISMKMITNDDQIKITKDGYVMVQMKKLCPMCIMHVGTIPKEQLQLCATHKNDENNEWTSIRNNRR